MRLDRRALLEVRRDRLDQRPAGVERGAGRSPRRGGVGRGRRRRGRARGAGRRCAPGAAPPASPARPRWAARAARAETWAWPRSSATGPTTTGPGPNWSTTAAAAARGSSTPPSSDDEPVALDGAQRVHAAGARGPAYLVEALALAALGARAAEHDGHVARDRPSPARWPGRAAPRRPRSGAPRRPRAPRAGRPRRRAPRRPGRRPRRWRTRPRGRSAARPARTSAASAGSSRSSMFASTTSIESRTRSTVCWRLITPARARGAAPKTEATISPPAGAGWSPAAWRYQSTKPRMPACTMLETQDRSSALSARNHAMSWSIRAVAAVASAPVARCSASAARSWADEAGGVTTPRGYCTRPGSAPGTLNPGKSRGSASGTRRYVWLNRDYTVPRGRPAGEAPWPTATTCSS